MLSLPDLLLYIAALAAVFLIPGPDMGTVMAVSMARGFRFGLVAACGLAASRAVHVAASGIGLAALIASDPALLDALRWVGALYLLRLAWKVAAAETGFGPTETAPHYCARAAFRQGFMTNLLNPKALLFCSLLLPQFVTNAAGGVLEQYSLLGALLVLTGLSFDAGYALMAEGFAEKVRGRRAAGRTFRVIFATVFAGTAVRLVVGG